MAVNVQGIGNALGAMGAGISGNLPAYMAAQNQEEKIRMEQGELRKKANFEDNRALMIALQKQDYDGAGMLLTQRYDALTQSGGDPTETMYAMKLLQTDSNQLLNETINFDASGVGGGYVAAMPDKYIKMEFDENGVPYGITSDGRFEQIETPARFPSGGGGVNVDIGGISTGEAYQKGANAFQTEFAKDAVTNLKELRKNASTGREQNINLSSMRNLNVATGLGAETKLNLARVANFVQPGLGDSLADVSATQAFQALSIAYTQSELNNATGPQTDLDFTRFQKTFASIDKEVDANNWLIDNISASNDRKVEQYEFYRNHIKENPELGYQTVDDAWIQFKRDVPMVSGRMDTNTGLPLLWNNFQKETLKENPDAKREEIIALWQELNAGMQ